MTSKQPVVDRLHDDLHRIPGMPSHDRAAEFNSNAHAKQVHAHATATKPATPHPSLQNRTGHHGDPRVFVRWQRFIARIVGRD
jgi:hypothetical protein